MLNTKLILTAPPGPAGLSMMLKLAATGTMIGYVVVGGVAGLLTPKVLETLSLTQDVYKRLILENSMGRFFQPLCVASGLMMGVYAASRDPGVRGIMSEWISEIINDLL